MKTDQTTSRGGFEHSSSTVKNTKRVDASPGQINLESYFKRIAYQGAWEPTLDTLSAIQFLHPQAIPFENLNPFLHIPVKLDLPSLQEKLVNNQRGGYCFEHNLLLLAVLTAIGFKVRGLAARVQWNVAEDIDTPRGHMLLLVDVDGKSYIADVGFGGNTLTAPLLLEPNEVQETPHGLFRIVVVGEEYQLQADVKNKWRPLYKFSLLEHLLPDYEVSSWYLSNHPDSHFVTGLIATRVEKDRRFALRNNQLVVHHNHSETEKKQLNSAAEIKDVLNKDFKIKVSATPEADNIFKKLIDESTG